jgi:hypothetical protein
MLPLIALPSTGLGAFLFYLCAQILDFKLPSVFCSLGLFGVIENVGFCSLVGFISAFQW